ncbi:MAG: ATP-grasp domain-containing protein [Actinomycetota bacterium]|nr:ATP-grasp domain-containing protein [Actinomycetota bacterium]
MSRVLLLVPTSTYRAADFTAAAARLGVDVVVGSERRQALASAMGDRAVVVPLHSIAAGVDAVVALHERSPLDAVVAVDEQGLEVAAGASALLGMPYNPPTAVAATKDKALMRALLALASVDQPEHRVVEPGGSVLDAAAELGYPCVAKPVSRSGSQGVIRVDCGSEATSAAARIRSLVGRDERLLVERFVPGPEIALEGLLRGGELEVLAVFDKPDPLDGPYFEETIYVTPSRHDDAALHASRRVVAAASAAIGLREGPVHAEVRLGAGGSPRLIEIAARSIGGLCSRALRFGAGVSLEEVVLRHAIGADLEGLRREPAASGVMMLPIRRAGVLEGVRGRDEALGVPGVVGVEITIAAGRPLVPLPEGDRYLGFIFARASGPAEVEAALRRAEACLEVVVRGTAPRRRRSPAATVTQPPARPSVRVQQR